MCKGLIGTRTVVHAYENSDLLMPLVQSEAGETMLDSQHRVLLFLLGGSPYTALPGHLHSISWSSWTLQERFLRWILALLSFNFDIVTCYIYINVQGLFNIISSSPNGISSPNNYTGITIRGKKKKDPGVINIIQMILSR